MNIGIIGKGMVGTAVHYGMSALGHNVSVHDIKLGTSLKDTLDSEIVFICVPTPSNKDGSCDTTHVESVVSALHEYNYPGIIAIKSTIIIGTTERLIRQHNNDKICFVPEFLRERCAVSDFTENQDLLIIGTQRNDVFEAIVTAHGDFPETIRQASPSEAEFCKYFNNIYNANLITLANTMYEICQAMDVNYENMKNIITIRRNINNHYINCSRNFRGFGGVCLPKDLRALEHHQAQELGLNLKLFRCLLEENQRFGPSILPGMRNESEE